MSRIELALALLLATAPAFADGPDTPDAATPEPETPAPEEEPEEQEEAKDPDRWFAVTGGTVHTVSGPVLPGVTVLAKNGRIVELGADVTVPQSAKVIDAAGMHVYPGLVAFDSTGLVGTPPEDSTDVFGLNLTLGLSAGITTVRAGGAIAKLTYGTLDGHLLGKSPLTNVDYSTPNNRRALRGYLEAVREHGRQVRAAQLARARGEDVKDPPGLKGKLAGYAKLLRRESKALVSATTSRALTEIAELALTYGFQVVVTGGEEAWLVAPVLGRAGVQVVVVPRARRWRDRWREAASGWSIENAARLHAHGVQIAVMSQASGIGMGGLAGRDLLTLPLEAAFTVRGGLDPEAALAAVTLGPARVLGVDDQIGSLDVGKDCDLVIARGDLLHYETLAEYTVVNGRVAYDKEQDSLLRHVRPRDLEGVNREIPQLWPRGAGEPEPELPQEER